MKLVLMLYIFGLLMMLAGVLTVITSIASDGESGQSILYSVFAILNGLIAMGVAEILKIVRGRTPN
ncbi:hypothetical protein CXF77_17265 [Planococcus sp. MB-3u-09]|uniref:hypothetical protein n=1 Tax=Planococcus alpniumensis TaxID=2708345 RepID=UPI000C34957D|nr:hypothetical protein [Planococcus sp. MSAK28401]AUD14972.1 hypothetical protein CW734_16495 [Planococcus sp. MB-3u-03]PKG47089.1 hypothetical protein CXF66_04625 [Planococcus sp. Urea-trap-24]PKG87782.1 hypothetical protein CXF91_17585 [Planococcus sp. Urea-3u-39]PKH35440.1 hypothetical protein CXF77_17265 [Planococcus sp. MB-3u-09]